MGTILFTLRSRKFLLWPLFVSAFLWSDLGFAVFDHAVVDIAKFKDQALAAMEPLGNQPIDIIFQDAASGAIGDNKYLVDGAYLMALGKVTNVKTVIGSYRLAYRTHLASGRSDLVFIRYTETNRSVVLPSSFFVVFDIDLSPEEMEQETIRLGKALGRDGALKPFTQLKRVLVESTNPTVEVFNQMRIKAAYQFGKKIRFAYSFERYASPINRGVAHVLNAEEFVDLDKLRDVVPKLYKEGYRFTTEQSRIPNEIKRTWWKKGSCGFMFLVKASN